MIRRALVADRGLISDTNLADIAHKGGNYLLNVGPTAEGLVPGPSVDILREVGGAEARRARRRAAVLLEGEVKVGAAEAEGAHPGAARVPGVADPRPAAGIEVEGRGLERQLGVGPLHLVFLSNVG